MRALNIFKIAVISMAVILASASASLATESGASTKLNYRESAKSDAVSTYSKLNSVAILNKQKGSHKYPALKKIMKKG